MCCGAPLRGGIQLQVYAAEREQQRLLVRQPALPPVALLPHQPRAQPGLQLSHRKRCAPPLHLLQPIWLPVMTG